MNPGGIATSITLILASLSFVCLPVMPLAAGESFHAGPLFDDFSLTLEPGRRTEVAGPLYYREQTESQDTWALPPFLASTHYTNIQSSEFTFAYPVMSYIRYGKEYRWHLFQILSFSGGPTQTETNRDRITLFPIYFQQRSPIPSENYTAYGPFFGHLQGRLFRDEITYIMFPAYSETRKADVVTDNYLFPIFHHRHGNGLTGWQVWPLVGHEHKTVTTRTNYLRNVETIPGHEHFFLAWPIYFNELAGIGTPNLEHQFGVIPAFTLTRSPLRDSTTVIWPFFSHIDDRGQKYREWDAPWPFIEFARGEGKYTTRIWPFYSHAASSNLVSDFYLWPIYKFNRIQSAPLDRQHTRLLFFLYTDVTDSNTENGSFRRRAALWPFYSYHRDVKGNRRLQVLALIEPFVPENPSVEREYAPIYSLWRSQDNAQTGASSQSLLWNLYRHESSPTSRKTSLFFGLWQSQSGPTGRRTKLFFIPLGKPPAATLPADK